MNRVGPGERDQTDYVLIVGLHSVGKTTLANALARKTGGSVVEMGDVVRAEARRQGKRNLVHLAAELLEADPEVIAVRALILAHQRRPPVIVVGPRTEREWRCLVDAVPEFLTVGILGSDELRERRWRRRRLAFTDTWDERESREKAWGTGDLVGLCAVRISGSDPAKEKLERVLDELRGRHA